MKSCPFVNGCRNYRLKTLRKHARSQQHKAALEAQILAPAMKKALQKAWSQSEGAFLAALWVCYWLAKEEVASIKYSSLINLLFFQGVAVLKKSGWTNYRHHLIVSDMQYSISSCIERHTDTLLHTPVLTFPHSGNHIKDMDEVQDIQPHPFNHICT